MHRGLGIGQHVPLYFAAHLQFALEALLLELCLVQASVASHHAPQDKAEYAEAQQHQQQHVAPHGVSGRECLVVVTDHRYLPMGVAAHTVVVNVGALIKFIAVEFLATDVAFAGDGAEDGRVVDCRHGARHIGRVGLGGGRLSDQAAVLGEQKAERRREDVASVKRVVEPFH